MRTSPDEEHEARARRWAITYAPFITQQGRTVNLTSLARGPAHDDVPLIVLLHSVACAVLPRGLVRDVLGSLMQRARCALRGDWREACRWPQRWRTP